MPKIREDFTLDSKYKDLDIDFVDKVLSAMDSNLMKLRDLFSYAYNFKISCQLTPPTKEEKEEIRLELENYTIAQLLELFNDYIDSKIGNAFPNTFSMN